MSAPMSAPLPPILTSIAPLAATTDAWIVDIWGVMHNGVQPFLPAAEAAQAFRKGGGTVVLLSNAPRPSGEIIKQLARIGVPREAWDEIITSGDATRELIARQAGRPVFHLGPERDRPLFDGLSVQFAGPEAADAIVCTGLFDDERETADDYREMLASFLQRKALMICANPDLTVERGTQIVPCAGALAEAYRALGGEVAYAGKPHRPVYEMAFAAIDRVRQAPTPQSRILAIGDGLRTDIAGAASAGIRSVFIASGIHVDDKRGLDERTLADLFGDRPERPVGAMSVLRW